MWGGSSHPSRPASDGLALIVYTYISNIYKHNVKYVFLLTLAAVELISSIVRLTPLFC